MLSKMVIFSFPGVGMDPHLLVYPSGSCVCAWTPLATLQGSGDCQELLFPCCSHLWSWRQIHPCLCAFLLCARRSLSDLPKHAGCGALPNYLSPINRTEKPHTYGGDVGECLCFPVSSISSCWHFAGCISLLTHFRVCQQDFPPPPSLHMARCCYHSSHVPEPCSWQNSILAHFLTPADLCIAF